MTTDEMDKVDPRTRNRLVVLCAGCNEWHHFVRNIAKFLATNGQVCACGSTRFVSGTLISEGTWNPKNKKVLKVKR